MFFLPYGFWKGGWGFSSYFKKILNKNFKKRKNSRKWSLVVKFHAEHVKSGLKA